MEESSGRAFRERLACARWLDDALRAPSIRIASDRSIVPAILFSEPRISRLDTDCWRRCRIRGLRAIRGFSFPMNRVSHPPARQSQKSHLLIVATCLMHFQRFYRVWPAMLAKSCAAITVPVSRGNMISLVSCPRIQSHSSVADFGRTAAIAMTLTKSRR